MRCSNVIPVCPLTYKSIRLLDDVVDALEALRVRGLVANDELHRFALGWLSADLPARASILNLKQVHGRLCVTSHVCVSSVYLTTPHYGFHSRPDSTLVPSACSEERRLIVRDGSFPKTSHRQRG